MQKINNSANNSIVQILENWVMVVPEVPESNKSE